MKVLMVAAVDQEVSLLRQRFQVVSEVFEVDFLSTGIGMVATACELSIRLASVHYDLVVNVGVAGAINRSFSIGDVVVVDVDRIYELAAEDGDQLLSFSEIGLTVQDVFRPNRLIGMPQGVSLPFVRAITVNTVHGNDESIALLRSRSDADIETMEGAAFYHVCNRFDVPCIQFRAISNFVERRNRDAWNLPLAIDRLTDTVFQFIQSMKSHA